MRTSSVAESIFNLLTILILLFVLVPGAYAKKGGGGGGKPGGDPPEVCNDVFPGFVYLTEATKKSPAEIYLASSDGCRRESIGKPSDFQSGPIMHVTEDGTAGVILWIEEPDLLGHDVVQRVDFTFQFNGAEDVFAYEPPVPMSLPGEGVPAEDFLKYSSGDVWGDANHDSLYLLIHRRHSSDGFPSNRKWLIYNLNDPTFTDMRELGNEACPTGVLYPQFVPECYNNGTVRWNTSGTQLYRSTGNNGWMGAVRINIDKGDGLALEHWVFSNPELIYAGPSDPNADYGEPFNTFARPPSATDPGEFLAMTFLDRTGQHTIGAAAILNVDDCTSLYTPYANGDIPAVDDLWLLCIEGAPFVGGNQGRQNSWQSSDDLLVSRLRNSRTTDIYRIHHPGKPDMSEELLIEGAERADSGF